MRSGCPNTVATVVVTVNGWMLDSCWPCARSAVDFLGEHPGRRDLDRHAEANATLAGFMRRAFMRGVR